MERERESYYKLTNIIPSSKVAEEDKEEEEKKKREVRKERVCGGEVP